MGMFIEGRTSFLKKRSKKLLDFGMHTSNWRTCKQTKVFWFFFKKEYPFLKSLAKELDESTQQAASPVGIAELQVMQGPALPCGPGEHADGRGKSGP